MASVRKREWTNRTGKHEAWVVDYIDQDGKRRHKQFKRKKEADEYRRRAELEVSELRHVHNRDTKSFGYACAEWFKEEKRAGTLKPSTIENLEGLAERHLKELEPIKLNKLKTNRLDEFMLGKHEAGYGTRYLGHMKFIIRKTLRYSCYKGWLVRDPLVDQPYKKLPKRQRTLHTPSVAEIQLLVDGMVRGPQLGDHKGIFYNARILLGLALLGMRRKEIRYQRWEHVNWSAGTLTIVREATKTDAGVRLVYLPNIIRAWLWEAWLRAGKPATGWVLRTRMGRQYSGEVLSSTLWGSVMERAGLGKYDGPRLFNLHMMRHFFVAYHRSAGIPDRDIKLVVGHADENVMKTVYDYALIQSDASARLMDKMEGEFGMHRARTVDGVPARIDAEPAPPSVVVRLASQAPYLHEIQQQAVALHRAGARTYTEIAAKVGGVSIGIIHQLLTEAGEDTSRYDQAYPPEIKAAALADYQNSDKSIAQIIREAGCGGKALYTWIRAAGIPLRQGGPCDRRKRVARPPMQHGCSTAP